MPAVAGFVPGDWTITRSTGVIDYVGDDHTGTDPSYATVIEFHRAIQDFADNATSSGDDQHDITDPDATDRSTDNIITVLTGYSMTAAAIEHLYDGSIIQIDSDRIWDGIVNFGNAETIQLIQNGAVLTDDFWNNDPFGEGFGLNGDAAAGISHRFLVEVRNGSDIDGRRLIGLSRTFNKTYGEFSINGSSRGNNVLALSEADDLNNTNTAANVAGWSISNTYGFQQIDIDNDTIDEDYYSAWDDTNGAGTGRAGTINDIYEFIKWATRDTSTVDVYGLDGELFRGITHEIDLNTGGANSGNFAAPSGVSPGQAEPVSWTGGTGQMLAVDATAASATTKMWIQLLTGTPPGDGVLITGGTSGATVTTAASNAVTDRQPVPIPFLGISTGSAIIGGYGVGFVTGSVGSNDQLFDLTNTARTPPNNITITVDNLDFTVSNEDYVFVGPGDGSNNLDTNQMSLNVALTTDNITSVNVGTGNIPADTPSSGVIRVADNNGFFRRLEYSSYDPTRTTFTITSTDGQEDFASVNANVSNDVFVGYIDRPADAASESFTGVNLSRQLFIRVRNGGNTPIKPFLSTPTVSADQTISVSRISDA